jgi:hypothetical protein
MRVVSAEEPANVFAEIKVGDGSEWRASTDIETGVSGEAVWMTKLSGPVTSENQLVVEKLKVLVWQKDEAGKDRLIGRAVVKDPQLLFSHATKWIQLMGELRDNNDEPAGAFSVTTRFVSMATKFMSAAAKFMSSGGSVDSGLDANSLEGEGGVEGYLDLYDIHVTGNSGELIPFT